MTLAELRDHLDFNEWANKRTFGAAATLSVDDLTRDLKSSFPSIRDTLAHMVGGEWVWFTRWTGESPTTFPEWTRTDTLDDLIARLATIEAQRRVWFDRLSEDDLARRYPYRLFNGTEDAQPLSELILHVVNHASYHRGQIATMMRQVGAKPVGTDRITYTRENGSFLLRDRTNI